ncbi:MAG: SpoIID/LytB domain-containing protein [Eubacteriales bacterium]
MRKKIFTTLLTIIILISILFPGTVAEAATDYKTIRVKLSISATSVSVALDGEYIISEDSSISLSRGTYTVSVSGGNVHISGSGVDKDVGTSLTFIRCNAGSGNNYMTLYNTYYGTNFNYLGNMNFTVSSGKLLVINQVPLEEYLYGVVAYEMSNSFPLEALKAQAVCARGYAIKSLSSSSSYDIGDTSSDQVYKGYNSSYTNVIAAVDGTRGQVLTYSGSIISTYYAASNGGQTELPGNAWGGGATKNAAYPYLAQRDDTYDTENPSTPYQNIYVPSQVEGTSGYDYVSISGSYVVRTVHLKESCNVRSGPGTSYSVVGTAPVNSVYTYISTSGDWYKINFNGTEAYIHGDYVCLTANGNYLYANAVLADIQENAYNNLKASGKSINAATDVKIIRINSFTNGTERWPGTGSRCYVTANANVTVKYLTSGSLSSSTDVNISITLMNYNDGYKLSHTYLIADYSMRGVQTSAGGYTVTNRRYGHGVGMSQRGAQTMASSAYNKPYSEILAFYFMGTTITTYDTTPPALPTKGETPIFSAGSYKVGGSNLTGLSYSLGANTFLSNLSITNGSIELWSSSWVQKTSETVVTGDMLKVLYTSGLTYQLYYLVIYGDVNGDGKVSIVDLLRIQKHLLGVSSLSGAYYKAADTSKNNSVSVLDLLQVQKHL